MAEPSHLSTENQQSPGQGDAAGLGQRKSGSQSWGEAMEHIKDNGIPEAY